MKDRENEQTAKAKPSLSPEFGRPFSKTVACGSVDIII